MSLPKIADQKDLVGKKVFVRTNLNVPIEDGKVLDQFRLLRGLSTITYLVEQGAKVILAGHIGREPENTLLPVYEVLQEHLNIRFSGDVGGPDTANVVDEMENGQVVLMENLRRDPRETQNDPEFVRQLASLADIYVNDDFAVSHRAHASMVGLPGVLPAFVGINFAHEVEELNKAMQPASPSLFLLGGAKFETKMPLVARYLEIYDHVFVGGALANDFFKAKGFEVGESLVSDIDLTGNSVVTHPKIVLPIDVTVSSGSGIRVCTPEDVQPDEKIMDAGPATIELLEEKHIAGAKTILWNGPFGDYEHGFGKETRACAVAIAASSAYSVIGGGDTVAAIEELHNQDQYSFLSTAGGAMLTFLEHGTLPAIEAIEVSQA